MMRGQQIMIWQQPNIHIISCCILQWTTQDRSRPNL